MASITASEKALDHVYCRDYEFRIPEYQRPYAWEQTHVEELLDDLKTAMERGEDYFLGSVVLIKQPEEPRSDVVDGQQRLTTMMILLCVLRELAGEDEGLATDLDHRIRQRADRLANRQEVVRLTLREFDQPFFHDNVQARGGLASILTGQPVTKTDSQNRLVQNARFLHGELANWESAVRESLAEFVIRRCFLVVVATDSPSAAYRIFAVMNDRGLDLSPTDVLKAEITGAIEDEDSRAANARKWEEIEMALGRDNFGDLFGHIRMVYAKEKQRRNLQEEFTEQVLANVDPARFVDDVLLGYADAYEQAMGRDESVSEEARRFLGHMARLDNSDWVPPTIELFKNPPTTKSRRILRYIRGLERLAYGLFILRQNVNGRIARFGRVVEAIQNKDHEEIKRALKLTKEEKEEIVRRLDGRVYEMTRVRMPLLLRLDGLVMGEGATYDHRTTTIEHVLPRNPAADSQWTEWFPDEEEREGWTHRLANLVLLSRRKNSQASNLAFERKRNEYFLREGFTPYALTGQVLAVEEWTPDVLASRQEELLRKLTDEWRLK